MHSASSTWRLSIGCTYVLTCMQVFSMWMQVSQLLWLVGLRGSAFSEEG